LIKKYIADLKKEFAGYNGSKLSKDLMAGLTVTAVALPLALAFGVSSGADAAAGLITAIFAGLVIGTLSGGSFQISGPTGAMSAILVAIVMKYGMQGVFVAGFLSGIILIICAILKVGKLVTFIPSAVITGFTSGIAIIIAVGQINNFFGVKSTGISMIEKVSSYFKNGFDINWYALAISMLVVIIMVAFPKKWSSILPSSLAAIIVAVIINMIFKLPLNVVGSIPKTLFSENRLDILSIPMSEFKELLVPAISIAALGMIESLLCGASAGRMKNEKLDADRELWAQGIGNIMIPFFGGVPATAAIARSSVGIKSGGQTRLTGIIHSIGLLASMFLLGGIMSKIPLSALAGVLMVTAFRMNEWISIKYIFGKKFRTSISQFLITMLATVVFDLTIAILIGVIVSIFIFVIKISGVELESSDVDYEKLDLKDSVQKEHLKSIKICYITGPIFFGSVEKLENEIKQLGEHKVLIFSMRGVPMIDAGSALILLEGIKTLKEKEVKVLFCGLQPKVKVVLERAGIVNILGESEFYWDAKQAIESQI